MKAKQKPIVLVAKVISLACVLGVVAGVVSDKFDLRVVFGLVVIGFSYWASWRSLNKDADRPLPKDFDSDGGIDWEEKGVGGQVFACSGSLALLVPDMAVFEADELCRQFTEAGVRFKLEKVERRHKLPIPMYGRAGLTMRMRVWVERADLAKAKPIADRLLKVSV